MIREISKGSDCFHAAGYKISKLFKSIRIILHAQINCLIQRFEEGQIVLFHNNNGRLEEKGFRKPDVRSGEGWARFGTAVANLGDINHDGLQDVAVGAPGQDGGAGAVHIYHGRRMPLLLDNSRGYTHCEA